MLLEHNAYLEDFPINIMIGNVIEYPIHYHQDIEFVFVLQGEIKLKNGCCTYLLNDGDIFTNNGHEVHAIYGTQSDNVVAIIQVSNLFFTQYFPELSKSCYRTYTAKQPDSRSDHLRKMLLSIILDYLKKSLNYKQKCINSMIEFIHYLNNSFNLFIFENQIVLNVSNDNAVLVERMSRMINYIYEKHAEKIVLADLAKLENLSEYYISHMIKDFTGMSFREILCFARVEWSEIYLLDTNKTITAIARDVGFSTTSFYEKHFIKWFGMSPAAHRKTYGPLVKSVLRPEVIEPLQVNRLINIMKQGLSSVHSQDNNDTRIQQLKLDISVDAMAEEIYHLAPKYSISVTLRDYETLGFKLYEHLSNFECKKIVIKTEDDDSVNHLSVLKNELITNGYQVELQHINELKGIESHGLDSIANLLLILKENLLKKDRCIPVSLMDYGDKDAILKGLPSLMTSCSIPKPSYYGYLWVSMMRGCLICWGKHHAVIRIDGALPGYIIMVLNDNDSIERLCTRNATLHETNDIINKFNDELDINFTMSNLPSGIYEITRYSMDRHNNIFDYMAKLNFPARLDLRHRKDAVFYTVPKVDIVAENVSEVLNLNISLKGVGMQLVTIQAVTKERDFE